LGISLGRFLRSPWKILLGLLVASVSSIALCYWLILLGWWVPIVPVLLVLVLNGAGLMAALFYRHEQELRLRLEERQFAIEQTFNAIHSGPVTNIGWDFENCSRTSHTAVISTGVATLESRIAGSLRLCATRRDRG
jgi:hypothetical protein